MGRKSAKLASEKTSVKNVGPMQWSWSSTFCLSVVTSAVVSRLLLANESSMTFDVSEEYEVTQNPEELWNSLSKQEQQAEIADLVASAIQGDAAKVTEAFKMGTKVDGEDALQTSASIDRSSVDGVEDLKSWLLSSGAIIHPCLQVERGDVAGRRLRMTCSTKHDDILLSLPSATIMWPTTNTACLKTTRAWKKNPKHENRLRLHLRLAMTLLGEKQLGAASRLSAYFRVLPQTYPTYAEDLVAVSKCYRYNLHPHEWIRRFSETQALEVEAIQKCAGVSEVEANWASHVVNTRSFKAGKDSALVPFVDFINHANQPNTRYRSAYRVDGGQFTVVGAGVTNDAEVTMSYGELPNDHMMLKYGMALQGNPHNVFVVRLGRSSNEPPVAFRLAQSKKEAANIPGTLKQLRDLMSSSDGATAKALEAAPFFGIRHACQNLVAKEAPAGGDDFVCSVYREGAVQLLKDCVAFAQHALDLLDGRSAPPQVSLQHFWNAWKSDVQDRLPEASTWSW